MYGMGGIAVFFLQSNLCYPSSQEVQGSRPFFLSLFLSRLSRSQCMFFVLTCLGPTLHLVPHGLQGLVEPMSILHYDQSLDIIRPLDPKGAMLETRCNLERFGLRRLDAECISFLVVYSRPWQHGALSFGCLPASRCKRIWVAGESA